MDSETIDYTGHGIAAHIVVSAANMLQGLKRTRLRSERGDMAGQPTELMIAGLVYYPDLIAASTSISITDIEGDPTFNQFCALPEDLIISWDEVVSRLNPHWSPQAGDEKKSRAGRQPVSTVGARP